MYSDGESAHEEEESLSDMDDDLEASFSSNEPDSILHRQMASYHDLGAQRLVIDEQQQLDQQAGDAVTKDTVAKDTVVKDTALSLAGSIKSEPMDCDLDDDPQLIDHNDVATSEQKALMQSKCMYQDSSKDTFSNTKNLSNNNEKNSLSE